MKEFLNLNPTNLKLKDIYLHRIKIFFIYFSFCVILLSLIRFVFCLTYRPEDVGLYEFFPSFWMGLRLDAKWLAIFLLPSWILLLFSFKSKKIYTLSSIFAIVGFFIFTLLDLINFGFYGFYNTPISPIIFGFFEDDTKAILISLWKEWPIFNYLIVLTIITAIPFLLTRFFTKDIGGRWNRSCSWFKLVFFIIVGTLVLAFLIRGSLGKFPLRQEDFAVSKINFVNNSVINGPAALYISNKSRKALKIEGKPDQVLQRLGFKSLESANDFLNALPSITETKGIKDIKNVVYIVMESMGSAPFDTYDEVKNDTLGTLKDANKLGVVFQNGVASDNGTFPSLERILFDTTITPLSQSKYGRKQFSFSEVLDFKKAGYKTIFLTGAPDVWRNVNETLPIQGFDTVIGAATIHEKFPNADLGPWGIGDKWVFKTAENILIEAEKSNEKVLLVILSTTNHTPYRIPDGDKTLPVNPSLLPDYVTSDKSSPETKIMLETYQYAATQLGNFILNLSRNGILSNSVIAATGDHPHRFKYSTEGKWHKTYGVPIIFWVPKSVSEPGINKTWVSHRDIFPTLKALSLGQNPKGYEGRNIFAPGFDNTGADTYNRIHGEWGFGVGDFGAVDVQKSDAFECYVWKDASLVPGKCSDKHLLTGKRIAASRAIKDFKIRTELSSKK